MTSPSSLLGLNLLASAIDFFLTKKPQSLKAEDMNTENNPKNKSRVKVKALLLCFFVYYRFREKQKNQKTCKPKGLK